MTNMLEKSCYKFLYNSPHAVSIHQHSLFFPKISKLNLPFSSTTPMHLSTPHRTHKVCICVPVLNTCILHAIWETSMHMQACMHLCCTYLCFSNKIPIPHNYNEQMHTRLSMHRKDFLHVLSLQSCMHVPLIIVHNSQNSIVLFQTSYTTTSM